MKTKLIILSIVCGLLFFGLGCMADSVAVKGVGAIAVFPGLISLLEEIWLEEIEVFFASRYKSLVTRLLIS